MHTYVLKCIHRYKHTYNMCVHICRCVHIYIYIFICIQDEVYDLYVYATTTTIGTNTQIFFFIADSCVSEPVDSKSAIKNNNLIITPHIAGLSIDSESKAAIAATEMLKKSLR